MGLTLVGRLVAMEFADATLPLVEGRRSPVPLPLTVLIAFGVVAPAVAWTRYHSPESRRY